MDTSWLTVNTIGDDLFVPRAFATWFGGDSDPEDNGETASGVLTKGHPDLMGCALPMDGCHSPSCNGSPIPKLPWKTMVEVSSVSGMVKRITVPLIDLGPALRTRHGIDLTVAAFRALSGGSLKAGLISVSYRIIGGAQHLPGHVVAQASSLPNHDDSRNGRTPHV